MLILEKKWNVLGVFFILWAFFTCFYSLYGIEATVTTTKGFELIKFLSTSVAVFGVVFSSMLTSFNSLESSKNNDRSIHFAKTENSFSYMERWDSPTLKDARDISRRMTTERCKISDNAFIELVEKDEDLKRSIIAMWNFFEEIELSIQEERVNETVLKRAFSETYCSIYDRYKAWLQSKRPGSEVMKTLDDLYKRWK